MVLIRTGRVPAIIGAFVPVNCASLATTYGRKPAKPTPPPCPSVVEVDRFFCQPPGWRQMSYGLSFPAPLTHSDPEPDPPCPW